MCITTKPSPYSNRSLHCPASSSERRTDSPHCEQGQEIREPNPAPVEFMRSMMARGLLVLFLCSGSLIQSSSGFSRSTPMMMSGDKTVYHVPNSGWTSPSWNWGYAQGTGHDCAAICRDIYSNKRSREVLLDDLLSASGQPENFEEVKLVLGLKFQNGRWDGSDGGVGGYGVVLTHLAEAQRYEVGSEDQCSKNFVEDMQARFHLLGPSPEDQALMDQQLEEPNLDAARRRCSGLVLKTMRFLEYGL